MANPDAMGNNNIILYNNMTESPLFENRITSQCNYALVITIALSILCYIQNKHFNIIQKINTQFNFVNNVSK